MALSRPGYIFGNASLVYIAEDGLHNTHNSITSNGFGESYLPVLQYSSKTSCVTSKAQW